MGQTTILLLVSFLAVLVTAKEFILEDLIAQETRTENRRIIHNIGDDDDQTRSRKVVRQSRVEDTIRTVQEPITGPGTVQPQQPVKDKGGGGKDDDVDEDKKTLAQQVADGKYGLIQTEIFSSKPNRPGIISYEVNPEVPKDNVNNLGGLRPDEIWLAENHLLVLSGGGFEDKNPIKQVWPAIDNYIAPSRQVKIPPNPKVPPPFPVQLKPGGPLEFIKNENGTGGPPPFYPPFPPPDSSFPPPDGSVPNTSYPYPPPGFNPGNFTPGNGPFLPPPFPFFPPPESQNGSFFLPPPGFIPGIPPGAAFLPPPGNLTDQYDEDDPSIYYPPPYDFYYPKDNSSLVPPGPLVPGIVLPPPPDFFAPYRNTTTYKTRRPSVHRQPPKLKSPTRKPGKHKNVQIITSTEEPFSGVTIRPHIGKVNILTTPPPVYYSTEAPITTDIYSKRPTIKTTTDNSLNEITPPSMIHALPPNAVVKGWVPIPAPRPFYITGPRKPLRKGTTTTLPPDYNSITPPHDNQGYVYNTPAYRFPENGWVYPNKSQTYDQQQFFKVITDSPKHDYYYDDYYPEKGQYISSTASPLSYEDQGNLKSIFYPSRTVPSSTISPAQVYRSPLESRGKSLKTFYFYEEPHISEGKLTDAEDIGSYRSTTLPPSAQHYRTGDPHTISEEVFVNPTVKQASRGNFKPSPLDYFYPGEGYINASPGKTNTESPLRYYYVPESHKTYSGSGYPYPPAGGNPATTRKPSSTKPPVYEYSFSVPGYGSIQPPKVGSSQAPEQIYVNPPQYSYNGYQSTPQPPREYNYNAQVYTTPVPATTPRPIQKPQLSQNYEPGYNEDYYTTPKPNLQTENPYHAFFTHHDAGLIDDITKKYFTTFGQKLNKDSIREQLTTPLPPADDISQNNYYSTSPRPQFYETDRPRVQSAQYGAPAYFSTPVAPYKNYNHPATRTRYPQQVYSYNYNQQSQGLVSEQKPISLETDLLVNYKEPHPPLNPDAEFIDPQNPSLAKPDQSFISYKLPGNGGGSHFFFLTPQAVRSQPYQQYNQGDFLYSNQYYKRNVRRPQTQRRKPTT